MRGLFVVEIVLLILDCLFGLLSLVPFAFSVLALRLFLQAIGYTRALVLGLDQPSAVPLVLSASQQAKLETDAIDRSS